MKDKELLDYINHYKPNTNFKYCDSKEKIEFGVITLKLKGIVEPNYGRMRLAYELYSSRKIITSASNYSCALDFTLKEYSNENYVFLPTERVIIIIEIKTQTIKFFKYPEQGFGYISIIKFTNSKLLFATKNSYWILNLEKEIFKVYFKKNYNSNEPLVDITYNNALLNEHKPSFLSKTIFRLRTFANKG